MSVVRIREPNALRPLQVTMLCLLGVTVAGGSLLLSAPESTRLVDGAIPWHEQSLLRAFVQMLCLNYDWATINAGTVKVYILGLGSGVAVTALGIALLAGGGDADAENLPEEDRHAGKHRWNPLLAAKFLVLLFLLWSFASSRWSAAPDLATGGSLLLVIHFLWAFALGMGLTSAATRWGVHIIVVITAVTAAVAIWYYYGRNPVLRAKFPFGNPQFLAACLIPGLLLALSLLIVNVRATRHAQRGAARVAMLAVSVVTLGLASWAFFLADTRGAMAGLALGLIAMWFFAARGRVKLLPVLLTLLVAASGWFYFSSQSNAISDTGRSATIRFRMYSWSYAWRMFTERPLTGHGQGGYVLRADSYAVDDVLDDPEVFVARIAHAHSEWLEVLADLGSVGLVLLLAALGLTFVAGHAALARCETHGERWVLIGLMSALVGLIVEECGGVGLRVSGVPTIYYTLIGLIWACSARRGGLAAQHWTAQRGRRITAGATAVVFGLAALAMSQQDWVAARNGYEAEAALAQGDTDTALALATVATTRLNPQRALTNYFRLSKAYLRAAQILQQRAADREQRALATAPINTRLAALAGEDYARSDEACHAAAGALKDLIERSPGFLNHGQVEYLIDLTGATNASGLLRLQAAINGQPPDDTTIAQARVRQGQFLKSAAAAAERELRRQPFNPMISLHYAVAIQQDADLGTLLDILARPLRYHRIGPDYVRFLESLSTRPHFDDDLKPLIESDIRSISDAEQATPDAGEKRRWVPERLRLVATVWFLRGDYGKARGAMELAVKAYAPDRSRYPLATASAWAELADCRFFDTPLEPSSAIEAAQRAETLTPPSQPGRVLADSVNRRLIQYLLAAGSEVAARSLLKDGAPPGVPESAVSEELGSRYRRLCESLLARREGQLLRKPVDELFPKMLTWSARALELSPDDPRVHRLAADMAFHEGNMTATAEHLAHAVERGLGIEDAMQFLAIARQQRPDSAPLNALWTKWTRQEPQPRPGEAAPPETAPTMTGPPVPVAPLPGT